MSAKHWIAPTFSRLLAIVLLKVNPQLEAATAVFDEKVKFDPWFVTRLPPSTLSALDVAVAVLLALTAIDNVFA